MGNTPRSAADRKRIRQEAEERRKAKENKVFFALVIVTVIILVAIFLGNFLKDEFTLPARIFNLSAIQDNWLVIDVDNKLSKRYHHPASFDIPEGYVPGEFTKYRDGVARDFYVVASDPEAMVASVYVDAASELTAAEYIQRTVDMRESALNTGSTVTAGEPFTATVAGMEAHGLYLHYSTEQGDYGCLLLGFDAPRQVCVTALISGAYTTPENVQTQEQLLAEAEVLLAGLTIID